MSLADVDWWIACILNTSERENDTTGSQQNINL